MVPPKTQPPGKPATTDTLAAAEETRAEETEGEAPVSTNIYLTQRFNRCDDGAPGRRVGSIDVLSRWPDVECHLSLLPVAAKPLAREFILFHRMAAVGQSYRRI